MKKLYLLVALLVLPGCVTALKSDKIISMKSRIFGIRVVATSAQTQTPEIDLGWISTVWQMVPTSTNGPITAPRYFDTLSIGQSSNPFDTTILENTGVGDVSVGTNATGQAIIPRLSKPEKLP